MAEMVSDMARAVRGVSIYPQRHPARERLLARLHEKIFALLADFDHLEISVGNRELDFLGEPIATRDGSAALLAEELFLRQVGSSPSSRGSPSSTWRRWPT